MTGKFLPPQGPGRCGFGETEDAAGPIDGAAARPGPEEWLRVYPVSDRDGQQRATRKTGATRPGRSDLKPGDLVCRVIEGLGAGTADLRKSKPGPEAAEQESPAGRPRAAIRGDRSRQRCCAGGQTRHKTRISTSGSLAERAHNLLILLSRPRLPARHNDEASGEQRIRWTSSLQS